MGHHHAVDHLDDPNPYDHDNHLKNNSHSNIDLQNVDIENQHTDNQNRFLFETSDTDDGRSRKGPRAHVLTEGTLTSFFVEMFAGIAR